MKEAQRAERRRFVLESIDHREPARIPYMILCQATIGEALARYYGASDLDDALRNDINWIGDQLPLDTLQARGLLTAGEYTDPWGVRWHGVGITRGQVKSPPLARPSLRESRIPERLQADVIAHMRSSALESQDQYRVGKLGALWEQATFLRGMEQLLLDLICHPEFVHELLEEITGYLLRTMESLKQEVSLDCLWLSDDYGSQQRLLMSPAMWRRFIEPRLRAICDRAHALGFRFALHSDGAISEILPDLVDIGIDLLHPLQPECVDTAWVKREFGASITIWGGFGSQRTLAFGTPRQVVEEVNAACEDFGAGGGFILTPGLALMNEVPLPNAVALIEAVQRHRRGTHGGTPPAEE